MLRLTRLENLPEQIFAACYDRAAATRIGRRIGAFNTILVEMAQGEEMDAREC